MEKQNINKAMLKANYTFLESLYKISNQVLARPEDTELKAEFSVRYRDIEKYRDRFQDAYNIMLTKEWPESVLSEFETYFNNFFELYYSIQVLHDKIYQTTSQNQVNNASSETFVNRQVRLPKIAIPHFSGSYTEWANFIAIFDSLIHQDKHLNNIQKMHYLVSVLEKEPLSLVKHLELSDSNYDVCYDLLKKRYQNKRLIADRHLDAMLSLTNINLNQFNTSLKRFINCLKENIMALSALGFDTNSWSFVLLHIMLRKLPADLRSKFELEYGKSSSFTIEDIPTFDNLLNFLEIQLRVSESVSGFKTIAFPSSGGNHSQTKSLIVNSSMSCVCCEGDHKVYVCNKFKSMSVSQRKELVTKQRLCYNCLRPHAIVKCQSRSRCQTCGGRHHTLLHFDKPVVHDSVLTTTDTAVTTHSYMTLPRNNISENFTMLLGTARVGVSDIYGQVHSVRALIDSGSQVTIITKHLAQKLGLPRARSGVIYGLGESNTQRAYGSVECSIHSLRDKSRTPLITTAVVLKSITGALPCVEVSSKVIEKCKDIELADVKFHTPAQIDLLIGIDLYNDILYGRRLQLGENMPTAHASIFGWILMGKAPINSDMHNRFTSLSCTVDSILSRFWETEEAPSIVIQDPEDVQCERHFVETHTRDVSGRFIVRLPFKTANNTLGSTYESTLKRFTNLERKLLKDTNLKKLYVEFMDDYLEAGHMRCLPCDTSCYGRYYLPHFGILKESSSSTKLRSVFDASAASSSGVSLNQVLMPGPKLQQNIEDIILRFRLHLVVFICDIKQMYRQVRLDDRDCKFQTILWRAAPDQPLQQFELTTVTYGVTSAAYLAIRVIHELADLNKSSHPEASRVLKEDTFVDDIISGSNSIASAKELQQQVVEVLSQGGFQLRKWASNRNEILEGYPNDQLEKPFRFEESGDNIFKVLGIEWNSRLDCFIYQVSSFSPCLTKRHILSNIARIYDPCGFLAPVTFYAKVIMQHLWASKVSWDDPLPEEFSKLWNKFADSFNLLKHSQIPRFILSEFEFTCSIMGFSDASECGFAAVVYMRVKDCSGVKVHLLLAKSRVAPLKQKLTIPRLELSGALLLARLISHIIKVLERRIAIAEINAWCDSSIVLAWLKTPPHKLQTFEGNRVSQVQGLLPSVSWRYVPSALNPADCASRGLLPTDLIGHQLWWSPPWLKDDPSTWPSLSPAVEVLPGLKQDSSMSMVVSNETYSHIIETFSSLCRLQRILAWSLRFTKNIRKGCAKIKGPLSSHELNNALTTAVKLVQQEVFSEQIKALQSKQILKGPLSRLNVFVDSCGLLRVGGRLKHSSLPYNAKFPVLLPKSHHLTHLIIDQYHINYLHAGPTYLVNILRQKFWILSARQVVRQRVFMCHKCFRLKAKSLEPFMGDLPSSRVRQARAFTKVGIDFAGPFSIKSSTVRKAKVTKAYLCVFICVTVKAVHLEVTSDLSTDAFLASLQRFVARRGLVSDIYTDCGKNFQGAKRHLKEAETFLEKHYNFFKTNTSQYAINWHMNPPYAPHMGGLWESTVKSAKQLLLRTVGEQVLTFEELSTVLARVEAVLNSRPLCPLSDDVTDLETLTPGHFLIGEPLVGLPEMEYDSTPISPLHRWKLVQQISQHFWRRWHTEYLHSLQQRSKWLKQVPNLQLGDLVLIKEDNIPPLRWKKGRISALHPGNDGVVRVVELRTATGSCLRSVTKLCPLPKL